MLRAMVVLTASAVAAHGHGHGVGFHSARPSSRVMHTPHVRVTTRTVTRTPMWSRTSSSSSSSLRRSAPLVFPPIDDVPLEPPTLVVGSQRYLFASGDFYVETARGTWVVAEAAPYGAVLTELPGGSTEQVLLGSRWASNGNAWFLWDEAKAGWVVVMCPVDSL